MRNLKRALSLALAAAMLISLMVVGASAAEYGDQAQVKQTEAVEVLTGLGVVGGDQNGNFNPTATLTRAEFCVMIANALTGGNFDQTLFSGTDTPFTDVAGHWGAGYIAYCYSNGIVAGTSATTFSPDSTLTAAQAAAILLMALGYNQNNEFGANGQFSLNVTRWAQQAGLYSGLSVSANAGISRENTAKLIFNALVNTTPVGYSSLAEAYYTIGESALSGKVYSGNQLDAKVPTAGDLSDAQTYYTYTLGYTNFGLRQNPSNSATIDNFQRPAHQWVSTNNTNIGTYADVADLTYTAEVTDKDMEANLRGYTLTSANVYDNGMGNGTVTTAAQLAALTGNGTLVEVYADNTGNITKVIVIGTYLAQATADYNEDEDELAIQVSNSALGTINVIDGEDFNVSAYQEDDYLLLNVYFDGTSWNIASVTPVTTLENATVNAYRNGDYVTANGTQYKYADRSAADSGALGNALMTTGGYNLGEGYNVYLDSYGYVIGVESYTSTIDLSNYVFIKDATKSGFEYIARAVFMDGTEKTITISKTAMAGASGDLTDVTGVNSTAGIALTANGQLSNNRFYSFSVDRNDEYELTDLADTTRQAAGTGTITNDATPVTSSDVTSLNNIPGTNSTVFIAKDSTYVGVRNAPTVSTASAVYCLFDENTDYILAVYTAATGTSSTSASDLVYILNNTPAHAVDANDVEYYIYDAIVDGTKTTLNANQNSKAPGLYEVKSYTDGYADLGTKLSTASGSDLGGRYNEAAISSMSYRDGVITVNGTSYILADDVQIRTVNGNTVSTINASGLSNVNTATFNNIILVEESSSNSDIVAIYLYHTGA